MTKPLKIVCIVFVVLILTSISALIFLCPKQEVFGNNVANGTESEGLVWLLQMSDVKPGSEMNSGQLKNPKNFTYWDVIGSRVGLTDIAKKQAKRLIGELLDVFTKYIDLGYVWKDAYLKLLLRVKETTRLEVMGHFSARSGGVLFGMVFGGDRGVEEELKHNFKVTGMLHVLSASGYNVGLVTTMTGAIIRRFWGTRRVLVFTLVVIFSYAYLAEWTPSVIRAACMVAGQITATLLFHRRSHPIWFLLLTVTGMLLLNPTYLTSISFQFSVLACFGILFWGWVFQRLDWFELSSGFILPIGQTLNQLGSRIEKIWQSLWAALGLTLAAQSFSWAIQLYHFSEVSWLSLIANPLLVWLTPGITLGSLIWMMFSLVAGGFDLIRDLFLPITALPLELMVTFFQKGVSYLARFDWLIWKQAETSQQFVVVWFSFCFIFGISLRRIRHYHQRRLYVT